MWIRIRIRIMNPDPPKSLNMDPIRIRIHNTGTNRILIFSVGTGSGTLLLNSCEFSTGTVSFWQIRATYRVIPVSQQYSPPMRNIFAESFLDWKNIASNNIYTFSDNMRANMPMEHGQNGAAGCDSEDQNVLRKTLKKKPKMFRMCVLVFR